MVGRHFEDITEYHQMTVAWEYSNHRGSPTAPAMLCTDE